MTEERGFGQEAGPESKTMMVCAQPTSHLLSWSQVQGKEQWEIGQELPLTYTEVHGGGRVSLKAREWCGAICISSEREEQELGYLLCSGGRG